MRWLFLCFFVLVHQSIKYADLAAIQSNEPKETDSKDVNSIPAAPPKNIAQLTASSPESNKKNMEPPQDVQAEAQLVEKQVAARNGNEFILYNVNLMWVPWGGSLPTGAVSVYNQYASRTDYVCSESDCSIGFYTPSKGPYCFYSFSGKEYYISAFKILVNKDNFELLQWQSGSYGSIPSNALSRCSESGIYIGKNKYGLGKVIPSRKAFFLPSNGFEYIYDYYDTLSVYTNYYSQKISSVCYRTNEATFDYQPSRELVRTKVINDLCRSLRKVVTLRKTFVIEQTWEIGRPAKDGVATILSTSIPQFTGTTMSLSSEEAIEWNENTSRTQTLTHLRNVELNVPPNHSCEVIMEGKEIRASVPFSARLNLLYRNSESRETNIEGRFRNVQVDMVTVGSPVCERLPNSAPCRSA